MKTQFRLVATAAILGATAVASVSCRKSQDAASVAENDPFIWLEQVSSPRAMAWVDSQNVKTLAVLEKDSSYAGLYAEAVKLAESKDRIPGPRFIDGQIYNFWQDADHVHGIWRKTSLASYESANPAWTTVLDLDALSKAENANWFWKGADCAEPAETRCMISLSDGGEDAVTSREFDLTTRSFVKDGFVIPHGKQSSTWEDPNTLLVAREWAPGELTASGYPYIVKRVKRGEPDTVATEVFRGAKSDVSAGANTVTDGAGNKLILVSHAPSFFEHPTYVLTDHGKDSLGIPSKAGVAGMVDGHVLISLDTAWTTGGGKSFTAGSVVSVPLKDLLAKPSALEPTLVYAPGPREAFNGLSITQHSVIMTILDNVRGRAFVYTPSSGDTWTRTELNLPDNLTIGNSAADRKSNTAFLRLTGFLTPTSLAIIDGKTHAIRTVKSTPPKFDASSDTVEQFEATSTDGTKIPYFVVHKRGMKLDGNNPTILYAYGGFQVSETPSYSANVGKLWLDRGGVWVLANIRGGGEFGPAWHEAGLKTHRQIIYDDFASVGKDLVARKITSARRLGIEGGSNGGLLMGVEFTEHPELWNAVDIQVPLLDMLRFEKIAAGASWVGEYGSVSNPDERAFLASISPYNNIHKDTKYPEPLIWTTTKDDRVGPQHARKFAAKLASMNIPYLFYEVTEGGHGSGASLNERAHTTALEMTYFTRKLMD
jgi:prolyl oligopeptidase